MSLHDLLICIQEDAIQSFKNIMYQEWDQQEYERGMRK